MQKEISPKIMALTFGVLTIAFLAAFYVVAWQEPTQAPPGGNVAAPINVGPEPQAKAGRISATEFYDYNDPNYYLNPSGSSRIDGLEENLKINERATYWDALQVCNFGTCCSPWKDCDSDGHFYIGYPRYDYSFNPPVFRSGIGEGRDCDEGCSTCYEGSSAYTATPNGRDENCNGVVDEPVALVVLNSSSNASCNSVCNNNGVSCISIGTDPSGTNGKWALQDGPDGGPYTCVESGGVGNCGEIMSVNSPEKNCSGHLVDWTYCKCQANSYK